MWNAIVSGVTDPAGLVALAVALVAGMAGFGLGAAACALVAWWMFKAEAHRIEYRMVDIVAGMVRNIVTTRETVPAPRPGPQPERTVAEAWLMDLGQQREHLDDLMSRTQHVLDGGHYDDSPNKWKKSKQRGTGPLSGEKP